MRFFFGVFLLAIAACTTAAPQHTNTPAAAREPAATTPSREPSNPNQEINDRYEQQIAKRIAGRENELAEQVFQNLQIDWLKDEPASVLLDIMNYGYSRALGVSCTHCHVEQDFASDEKRPKRAAREMAVMHRMINQQLRKMQNLETPPDNRPINCSTCHRGAINPKKANQ
jgi:photosynthetic reaction center cytochrome c subunit